MFTQIIPATYDQVITVTALEDTNGLPCRPPSVGADFDDTFASFTNWAGPREDTLHTAAAPGVDIDTTYPTLSGSYRRFAGTSAAAPHVTGLAAMYLKVAPTASRADVLSFLKATGEPPDQNFTPPVAGGIRDCVGGDVSHVNYQFAFEEPPRLVHPEVVVRADAL